MKNLYPLNCKKTINCFIAILIFALSFGVMPRKANANIVGTDPFTPTIDVFTDVTWAIVSSNTLTLSGFTVAGCNAVTYNSTNGLYYAILKISDNSRRLVTVNPATGVCTNIGLMAAKFSTLTYSATTNTMYTMGGQGAGATYAQKLYSVNMATGATTFLAGPFALGVDGEVLAYNSDDGYIYHWSGNGTANMEKINTSTFVATSIPQSGTTHGEIFGAVYSGGGVFIVTDISSRALTITTAGVVALQATGLPFDVRGLALSVCVSPTISCSGGTYVVANDEGSCSATISDAQLLSRISSSTGTPSPTITFSPAAGTFAPGSTIVTATATNSCGTATCDFEVYVYDYENPGAVCQNVTIYLDAQGYAYLSAEDIDGGSTDNCGVDYIEADWTDFYCQDIGTNSVTLTVWDAVENSSTCKALVTVVDDMAPEFDCPENITLSALTDNCFNVATWDAPEAWDNCGIASVVSDPPSGSPFPVGETTVTVTATDYSENQTSCTFTVTVTDDQDPEITGCPEGYEVSNTTGQCGTIVNWVAPTASDNCPGVSLTSTHAPGSFFPVGGTQVTYTATDAHDNTVTCSFWVYVYDEEAPNAVCQNLTVYLDEDGYASINFQQINNGSTDNCGDVGFSVSPSEFGCDDVGENEVTLTVVDIHDNSSTCTATVTVVDDIAPQFNQLGPVSGTLEISIYDWFNSDTYFSVTDGLNNQIYSSPGSYLQDVYVDLTGTTPPYIVYFSGALYFGRVYCNGELIASVSDREGEFTTEPIFCEIPVGTCPENITVNNDEEVCGAAVYFEASAWDNCSAEVTFLPESGSLFEVGTTTVTATATDPSGNTAECTFTVTVNDTEAPHAQCQQATVYLDENGNGFITSDDVNNESWDNCGIESMSVSQTEFNCENVGENTVTLTVYDIHGNSSTCEATVIVVDNVQPQAYCQSAVVQLDENGNGYLSAESVDAGSWDACGIDYMEVSPNSFTCENVGENYVTLYVYDNNGNVSTCETTVMVEDNVAPEVACHDLTVELNPNGTVNIITEDLYISSYDACGIVARTISPDQFYCEDVGENTVVMTITDANGNQSTCTSVVTVQDNIAPLALCQSITVQLDENGQAFISGEDVDGGSSDLCGIGSLSVSPSSFNCENLGENTVVLTVTDVNGNSSTCETTVMVEDNIAPALGYVVPVAPTVTISLYEYGHETSWTVTDGLSNVIASAGPFGYGSYNTQDVVLIGSEPFTFNLETQGTFNDNVAYFSVACAGNPIIEGILEGGQTYSEGITACTETEFQEVCLDNIEINNDEEECGAIVNYDTPVGYDNCSVTVEQTEGLASGELFPVGTTVNTFVATDGSGNTSTCSFSVTVYDTENPNAVCQGVTVQLDENGNASITADDVNNESWDNCGIESMSVSPSEFNCDNVGENTVTLTVTDIHGNSSSCEATVVVEDNVAPDAVCQNITLQLDANGEVNFTTEDIDGGSTDACGIMEMIVTPNFFDCDDVGENTVTLTVIDNNGNSSTCEATVMVEDNVAPAIICQNIIVQLNENGTASITADDVEEASSDACGITEMTVSTTSFSCEDVGENTVVLTVTDNNGNSSSCEATVTVQDNIAPDAVCQNVTVELNENGFASISDEDIDGGSSDVCGVASISASQTEFDCSDVGENTVILSVTDVNGNTSTCEATVTVQDNIAPMLSVSEGITVCATGPDGAVVNYNTPEFYDNCEGSELTQTAGQESGSVFPIGTTTNTFMVMDASGNMVEASFDVTVNSLPVADFSATTECNGTAVVFTDASSIGSGSIDVYDWNFSDFSTSADQNPEHLFQNAGTFNVTLTVTSDAGCQSTVSHEVVVNPLPTFTVEVTGSTCNGLDNGTIVVVVNQGQGSIFHSLNGGPEQELNTFQGLAPGDYTVTTRNENNCVSSETVTVTEPEPLTFAEIASTGVACAGDAGGSVTIEGLGGTAPYQYYIDGGSVNHPSGEFNNESGGEHDVTVVDANNCLVNGSATVPVLVGLPFANFTYNASGLEFSFANTSTGGDTYLWHFGDGPFTTQENPIHTFPPNGNYNVTLIAYNECGSDTITINLGVLIGIDQANDDGYTMNVFPNPNNGSFTMMLQSSGYMDELTIRLFTVEGKLIDDMIVVAGGNSFTKNFNYELSAGMYVLEVSQGDNVAHKRIIIK